MIRITNLSKRRGDQLVLAGVTTDIEAAESVAILGSSGSGKTTLLRCCNALESFDEGRIEIAGFDLGAGPGPTGKDLVRLRQSVGFVFQDLYLFPHLTLVENVSLAPRVTGLRTAAEARRDALELLERVGLQQRAADYPHQLSGGQRQRVAIARALAPRPSVLLLDEPTSALDRATAASVADTIVELTRGRVTLVLVTHQPELATRMADRILHLEHGVLTESAASRP
ncbi:MAG TPA: ATP-binding cassette domain-containing protein [Polyangiaceae bacterium]|jgi:ABC-type polar amino acid transport system ATPase subunit|nr:ATP-binding cassette domain-containing protein [Polyangiaceae bacterium]